MRSISVKVMNVKCLSKYIQYIHNVFCLYKAILNLNHHICLCGIIVSGLSFSYSHIQDASFISSICCVLKLFKRRFDKDFYEYWAH